MDGPLHEGEVQADEALVRRLLSDQHPDLADRPVRRVASTGTDHAVFRLGDDLVVRTPRIGWAEQQVEREAAWLPLLAPNLPVEIPVPVAVGEPAEGYPFRWLVSPWLGGTDLLAEMTAGAELDDVAIACDLAAFLRALQAIDPEDGPVPGKRGRELAVHDEWVRACIADLADEIDVDRAIERWDAALAAEPWPEPKVWLHGDLLPGNVVVRGGRVAGVIDWSPTGVGDPACELMIAWSLSAEARAVLRSELAVDDDTWARARGWVIEQAVPFIPYYESTLPDAVAITRRRLAAALADV
ncbi:MAG TPA: aminoglycoside phosphotransferase family protein [Acidimicrobiales bacterium]|nr:aminoglycoside phosphotransferase family protein [Acidimicrobiales bacterium]